MRQNTKLVWCFDENWEANNSIDKFLCHFLLYQKEQQNFLHLNTPLRYQNGGLLFRLFELVFIFLLHNWTD